MEEKSEFVRLAGLSATLPNYQDVAAFLRLDEKKAYFISTHPTALAAFNSNLSVSRRRGPSNVQITTEVCYDKVLDQAGKDQTYILGRRLRKR